jgi:SMODS and SLOG-associating 2TM effector domain 2
MKRLPFPSITWSNNNINPGADAACLGALRKYIVGQAQIVEEWYQKRGPIRWVTGRVIIFLIIACAAAAGILPLFRNAPFKPYWISAFVAIAGALVLIDSSFTLSSSWTRYTLSAQKIGRLIENFQFDWEILRASWNQRGPDSRQIADALELLKQTALNVLQVLEHEVATGAIELRADVRSALEVRPDVKVMAGANVIITNSDELQDEWVLEVDGRAFGRFTGGRAAIAGLSEGMHQFRVEAIIGGRPQSDAISAQISTAAIANIELTLTPRPTETNGPFMNLPRTQLQGLTVRS